MDLFDLDGHLIPYSHPLWSELSNKLNKKITAHTLYTCVQQDRHELQTKLREFVKEPLAVEFKAIMSDENDNSNDNKYSSDSDDEKNDFYDTKSSMVLIFHIEIISKFPQ